MRLLPVTPPERLVELLAHPRQLRFARHARIAQPRSLLRGQSLARRALLKGLVDRLRQLDEAARVARMPPRPGADPLLVLATGPRNDAVLERLAGHRRQLRRGRARLHRAQVYAPNAPDKPDAGAQPPAPSRPARRLPDWCTRRRCASGLRRWAR